MTNHQPGDAVRVEDTDIPFLTADQMREVDRRMAEDYGILLVQMMESAGRSLAQLARQRFLDGDPRGRRVLVLVGTGGNGGGGLACARWLHNWGAEVRAWLTAPPDRLTEVPAHQLAILQRMGVPLETAEGDTILPPTDLIVDALIGYSLRGAPGGAVAGLIRAAQRHGAPVLALDVPSGVDATSGVVHEPAVRAAATLTLALPKHGLSAPAAREAVGELYLADIGVPPRLYEEMGIPVKALFARGEVLRVW